MSVARNGDAGHSVTFTKAGGFIENEATGQRKKFRRVDSVYRLKVEDRSLSSKVGFQPAGDVSFGLDERSSA